MNNTPTIGSRILGTTQVFVAAVLEIVILLYFLLAGGDLFLQKFIKVLPHSGDKRKAVEIARATEAAVSAYLSTAFLVNVGEGIVVGAAALGARHAEPGAVGRDRRLRWSSCRISARSPPW